MIVEDQSEVVAFLSRPEVFDDGTQAVERIETHISQVFIGRDRVFKLKRAVRFPYLDFSTADRRRESCVAEVAVNQGCAPKLYKGVRALRRGANGKLNIDGDGEAVDWVVEMVRFDQDTLFDRLATAGKLDRHMMDDLADVISAFHAHGEPRTDGGGRAGIARTIESDDNAYLEAGEGVLSRARTRDLKDRLWGLLDQVGPLLEERRLNGCVRMCHGDLHLRNIFLMEGRPVLFDAIEFNNNFNIIDVLYDLAFLLMDLQYRGLGDLANVVMNRYLDITGASWGLGAMGLFLSMRASSRAHINAALAKADGDRGPHRDAALAYFDMAMNYLRPSSPRLIAVGGLSGSGKSLAGRALAPLLSPQPGARIVRSDTLRKRLMGVHPLDRLDQEGYSREMTEKTYQAVYDEVEMILSAGHSVIADAVFAGEDERRAIAQVAERVGVPFDGLWLEAPEEVMIARVGRRVNNPSDADAEIVRRQLKYDLGEVTWNRIDSSGSRERTHALTTAVLGL